MAGWLVGYRGRVGVASPLPFFLWQGEAWAGPFNSASLFDSRAHTAFLAPLLDSSKRPTECTINGASAASRATNGPYVSPLYIPPVAHRCHSGLPVHPTRHKRHRCALRHASLYGARAHIPPDVGECAHCGGEFCASRCW